MGEALAQESEGLGEELADREEQRLRDHDSDGSPGIEIRAWREARKRRKGQVIRRVREIKKGEWGTELQIWCTFDTVGQRKWFSEVSDTQLNTFERKRRPKNVPLSID
jgi:hypothetical protein